LTSHDHVPSSDGPSEESGDRPSGTGRAGAEASCLSSRFARGEPDAVAATAALVGKVVKTRGYYIPLDERPDVIQETLLDLVHAVKGRGFDDDDEFHAFARTVAYRRCIDWTRQATRRARIDPSLRRLIQPDDPLLARERRTLAMDVFSKLKRPCRELLALRVGRGLAYAQMARLLGRSEGALRTQSYYCLKQARAILNRQRRRKLVRLADWRQR
jgi:RNA polymerase sigma factor (sigma-70 family)